MDAATELPKVIESIKEIQTVLAEHEAKVDEQSRINNRVDEQLLQTSRKIEEIGAQMRMTIEETSRQSLKITENLAKSIADVNKSIADTSASLNKSIADTSASLSKSIADVTKTLQDQTTALQKNLGGVSNEFGLWAESYFEQSAIKKFAQMGYAFSTKKSESQKKIKDAKGNLIAEVDIWLESKDCILAVEVKSSLRSEHVNSHVKRLGTIRKYLNVMNDKRKLLGAVAGMSYRKGGEKSAMKAGLYVLKQNGDNVAIMNAYPGWKPREF